MKVFLAGANGKKKLLELYDNVLGIRSNKVASALESACTDRQTDRQTRKEFYKLIDLQE